MKVEKDKVVTIDYSLKDDQGNMLDSSAENGPLSYIHGNGSLIPGLEAELENKTPGDSFSTDIHAENAYGQYNDELIFEISRETFEDGEIIEEGMQFQARMDDEIRIMTVKEVKDASVIVDANHPLAGQNLHFDINIIDVREPTDEELEHGHVHDEHGMHEDDEYDEEDDLYDEDEEDEEGEEE